MTRARRLKMLSVVGAIIIALAVASMWTYGSGERTYYGPHTGILHTGDSVAVAEDISIPDAGLVHRNTRGIVQADPAWDEDSCDPDRLIALQLSSDQRVSVPRRVLHRSSHLTNR